MSTLTGRTGRLSLVAALVALLAVAASDGPQAAPDAEVVGVATAEFVLVGGHGSTVAVGVELRVPQAGTSMLDQATATLSLRRCGETTCSSPETYDASDVATELTIAPDGESGSLSARLYGQDLTVTWTHDESRPSAVSVEAGIGQISQANVRASVPLMRPALAAMTLGAEKCATADASVTTISQADGFPAPEHDPLPEFVPELVAELLAGRCAPS